MLIIGFCCIIFCSVLSLLLLLLCSLHRAIVVYSDFKRLVIMAGSGVLFLPLVSVVIATFDRAELLVQAVTSVLRQSYSPVEVLVADDGSTDDTATRMEGLDGPLHYLPLEHTGRPSVVRNRALAVARGDLVAFLDDDDLWQPHKLERQVERLVYNPALGFVYSDVRFLYPDGTVSAPVLAPHQRQQGRILSALLGDCFIYPSTVVVRRPLLDAVGWFDETYTSTEDYELWLRLAYAAPAGFVAEPLTLVRRHPISVSQKRELDNYQNTVKSLERIRTGFTLSMHQRWRLHRTLARMYTHVGLLLLNRGAATAGRRQLVYALRRNPLQRRAWLALAASYRQAVPW